MQGLPLDGCQQAVFALQVSESAELLREVSILFQQCAEQSIAVRELDEQFNARRKLCKESSLKVTASFEHLMSGREEEEAQLVFMQDRLAFCRQQVHLPECSNCQVPQS